jgi:hypothetical protein
MLIGNTATTEERTNMAFDWDNERPVEVEA